MNFLQGWPDGVALRRFPLLDSTNEEARRLARAGECGPQWIAADAQSKGRGRRGREWVSQSGNLFATLLMQAAPPRSAEVGFVAGIAVVEAVSRYTALHQAKLKWPNDLLVGGRKLAGILVEQVSPSAIAAGVGINIAHHPDDAISIAAVCDNPPAPVQLLSELATAMECWLDIWRMRGFKEIRAAWIARAGGVGHRVKAALARDPIEGVFESLDIDGALLLRDAAGAIHRITAADVFYGP